MMKMLTDTHTHTVASGHAYSTLESMLSAAKDKGLEAMAITEHGPAMPDAPFDYYFYNLKILPKVINGVRLLKGIELSILDTEGTLEMEPEVYKNLELVIASIHPPTFLGGVTHQEDVKINTKATIEIMKNEVVNIIGHPDDTRFQIDYNDVVKAAKDTNTLLEVNNHSLSKYSYRAGAKENYLRMLDLCVKHGVGIVVGSDAHYETYVAEHSSALTILERIQFPEELIISRNKETLLKFLEIK